MTNLRTEEYQQLLDNSNAELDLFERKQSCEQKGQKFEATPDEQRTLDRLEQESQTRGRQATFDAQQQQREDRLALANGLENELQRVHKSDGISRARLKARIEELRAA